MLTPTAPAVNGTYSHLVIKDPVIPGADYDIGRLLEKEDGAAKAADYIKLLEGSAAGKEHQHLAVQNKK